MEQFSLDKYFANPQRKIVTRDGRQARIICTDVDSENAPIVALIKDRYTGHERALFFTKYGKYYATLQDSNADLFFAPTKHTDYINIYHNESGYFLGGGVYTSEENAKSIATRDEQYITTIKVEWEE